MIRKQFVDRLAAGNFITSGQHQLILDWLTTKPFSLHWELRAMLYAGVLLLSSGIGIIIYNNIDTIGHTVIISLIAIACFSCFYFCFKNRLPYTHKQVIHSSPWFDYILLLGCLLFLALEGYLQYQYNVFGTRYGLASLIPAILFFLVAYYFDHAGILAMAITAVAAFAGISVSPGILFGTQLSDTPLIYTGATLAVFLIGTGYYLKEKNIKRHFTFQYYNIGFNIFFLSMLGGMFTMELPFVFFGLLAIACGLLTRYAILEKSFYFLLMAVIYGYIGCTWALFQLNPGEMTGLFYFVFSCVGVIWFFINFKKILRLK